MKSASLYTATDPADSNNTLTFTVLDRYEVYTGALVDHDGYDLSRAACDVPDSGEKQLKFARLIIRMTGTGKQASRDYTGISSAICTVKENGRKIEYMTFGGLVTLCPRTSRSRLISTIPYRFTWFADMPDTALEPSDNADEQCESYFPNGRKNTPADALTRAELRDTA